MRILLAGDTHANRSHFLYLFKVAQSHHCDIIFQLGDFGYFPHDAHGIEFLAEVSYRAGQLNIPVYWLDGNHDDFSELFANDWEMDHEGFWKIMPNMLYSPRGHVWTWDGIRFISLGGAYSIDKDWRLYEEAKLGRDQVLWWPQELITEADLHHASNNLAGEPVDVFLCHDKPANLRMPDFVSMLNRTWVESENNQAALMSAVEEARPSLLFHGHYHHFHRNEIHSRDYLAVCYGLDCDGTRELSWRVLDLPSLEVSA